MRLPVDVSFILDTLHKNGFSAYVVGGCVRDTLLGKTPKDWDICTSAKPEKVMEIFKKFQIIPTGLQHGTITVMINSEGYEITTYRIDGDYSDGRHPNSVSFTSDLAEDLARRDITINAMAYSEEEGIVDLYNGISDLKNKIIRCVGKAEDRFEEDALRVLRVLRFASVLGFKIDSATKKAIYIKYINLSKIAKERVNVELSKTLMGVGSSEILNEYRLVFAYIIPELASMFDFEQHNPHHCFDIWNHTLKVIENIKTNDLSSYLAALLHDIGKPLTYTCENGVGHFKGHAAESMQIAESILKGLKYSNSIVEETLLLVKYHDIEFKGSNRTIRRLLSKLSESTLYKLLDLRRADILGQSEYKRNEKLEELVNFETVLSNFNFETECFGLKSLNLDGKDLIMLGIKPGKEMGNILNLVLQKVVDEELSNDRELLIGYVKKEFL